MEKDDKYDDKYDDRIMINRSVMINMMINDDKVIINAPQIE
jgi:hypothetical protein